ncbi:MAG: hypothetical protein ACOYKZ_01710, partial [Chlamydiia bacterium]
RVLEFDKRRKYYVEQEVQDSPGDAFSVLSSEKSVSRQDQGIVTKRDRLRCCLPTLSRERSGACQGRFITGGTPPRGSNPKAEA